MISFADVGEFLPDLLRATVITLELTIFSFAIALVVGLTLALGRLSTKRVARVPATIVVEFFRGTPLIFQLFFAYYVLPSFGVQLDAFPAAVAALSLNYSAYMSEVYRAGIQSIDRGQIRAGLSLGMPYPLLMRRIILPQAIRVVIGPLGNYLISMFKDTSLASIVTLKELLFQGEIMAASTYKSVPIFILVGGVYLAISYPSSLAIQALERRLKTRHRRPRGAATSEVAA